MFLDMKTPALKSTLRELHGKLGAHQNAALMELAATLGFVRGAAGQRAKSFATQ